ncbi:hypothetical protein [Pseudomonas putida]|uniref:hypothetical protein n=1 Tax=Pseudomonas putida TaxID=303 RepID=UPI001F083004|nr:hypothetical protein [Pseudomonas putida]WQE52162.1 hypothetical protein U0028_20095 [Pseudomonas putida]
MAFLIIYEFSGRSRHFQELQTYMFANGKHKKVRSQPALPWKVNRAKAYRTQDEA